MYFVYAGVAMFVVCAMAIFALDIVLVIGKLLLVLFVSGLILAAISFMVWFFRDILRVTE